MSKQKTFSNFLSQLEEYENVNSQWCDKLIANGRQILLSIYNNIDIEHLTHLTDSFMKFILLLAQCHPNSLSDEEYDIEHNEQTLNLPNESQDVLPRNDIIEMMNNDLQCPICNEWLLRATSANCNHTFCETCIHKWLKINKTCPVCRTSIQYTSTSIAVDNFISNLCSLFGGFIKKRRESIQNARIDHNKKQTNADLSVDELINDLSISQLIEEDTYISQLETTLPMSHPNLVRLLPSPHLSQPPEPRVNLRQPIVSTNISHPNVAQLLPFPQSSTAFLASSRANQFQSIYSTSVISSRFIHQQTTSTSVTNPSVNRLRNNYNIDSSTR